MTSFLDGQCKTHCSFCISAKRLQKISASPSNLRYCCLCGFLQVMGSWTQQDVMSSVGRVQSTRKGLRKGSFWLIPFYYNAYLDFPPAHRCFSTARSEVLATLLDFSSGSKAGCSSDWIVKSVLVVFFLLFFFFLNQGKKYLVLCVCNTCLCNEAYEETASLLQLRENKIYTDLKLQMSSDVIKHFPPE